MLTTERAKKSIRRLGETQGAILMYLATRTPDFFLRCPEFAEFAQGSEAEPLRAEIRRGYNEFRQQAKDQMALIRGEALRGARLHSPEALKALGDGRPEIKWAVEDFMGRKPTRSESAAWSRALAKLERRGLVTRIDQARTYRVRLTPTGVDAAAEVFKWLNDPEAGPL